jgi:excisionase family DNA binding protein
MFLTKKDIATELKVSTRTVSRLLDRREIQSVRVGGQIRITDSAFILYKTNLDRVAKKAA